jgi:hypothetical protein
VVEGVEELQLGGLLRGQERNILEHEQVAVVAKPELEAVHLLAPDRFHEFVRERFRRGVDDPALSGGAGFGLNRARQVGLAEPGVGLEVEEAERRLVAARNRDRSFSCERVARADDEIVEGVRQGPLRGRPRDRRPTRVRGAKLANRCDTGLPPGRSSLRRQRVDDRARAFANLELDRDRSPGLVAGALRDARQEALADPVAVERGRTQQSQPVSVLLGDEGANPRVQREGGNVVAQSAHDSIPEL